MIANTKYKSLIVTTTLTMLALSSIAQETPAPPSPNESNGKVREWNRTRELMQLRGAMSEPKRIGVMVEPINDDLRKHLDLPEKSGVIVMQVVESSPAAKAGIKKNDIIFSANDQPVGSREQLTENVRSWANSGKELRLAALSKGVKFVAVIPPVSPEHASLEGKAKAADDINLDFLINPQHNAANGMMLELKKMERRKSEEYSQLKNRLEKQQEEIARMRTSLEQLSKAVREMKQRPNPPQPKDKD
jgi:membrane-associated protease RseP (regulator of RpoE activity)